MKQNRQRQGLLWACFTGWGVVTLELLLLGLFVLSPGSEPSSAQALTAPPMATPAAPHMSAKAAPTAYQPPAKPVVVKPVAVDPNNPFTTTRANILGLPIEEQTTIVLDAVERSGPWLEQVKAALAAGLSQPGPRIQVMVLQDGKIVQLTSKAFHAGTMDRQRFERLLKPIQPIGRTGLWTAVEAGRQGIGGRMVLITPRTDHWENAVNTLGQKLGAGANRVRLDVVQLGEPAAHLRSFVEGANSGRYTVVHHGTFADWRD
jgi:hypothetical protein